MAGRVKTKENDFEILFTCEQIQERVVQLGKEIEKDYEKDHNTPLILLGVLKGAVPFITDLTRNIQIHPIIRIDYIGVSSYGSGIQSSREPQITKDTQIPIWGKNIIVVEDIIDTGYSIDTLVNILKARNPKSLKICSFLSKPDRREIEVPIDYLGFEIPDLWVQGYGLDTDEEGRHWPYIAYRK
jgi:hypoxanthine phosphoribosyltransferase